jgi:hypothetical protein
MRELMLIHGRFGMIDLRCWIADFGFRMIDFGFRLRISDFWIRSRHFTDKAAAHTHMGEHSVSRNPNSANRNKIARAVAARLSARIINLISRPTKRRSERPSRARCVIVPIANVEKDGFGDSPDWDQISSTAGLLPE